MRTSFKLLFLLFVLMLPVSLNSDSYMTTGQSIAAYNIQGAYLIDGNNDIFRWDPSINKWKRFAVNTPEIKQMDCLNDGKGLFGTDNLGKAQKWNGLYGGASNWTHVKPDSRYDWVLHDHITNDVRGLLKGVDGSWEEIEQAAELASDPWDKQLPLGPAGSQRLRDIFFVSTDLDKYTRWERGDLNYFVTLNRGGGSNPFHIYYYGENSADAFDRILEPGDFTPTKNIEEVFVSQISYDEVEKNLWCIDSSGVPWQWHDGQQQWIKRDIVSDEGYVPEEGNYEELISLLRTQNDFYINALYIKGEYKPRLIVFKDSHILQVVLGEKSSADWSTFIDYVIYEDKRKRDHSFHNLLLKPKETPQKIVRIDGAKRISENHYLERLLEEEGIIANPDDIGVYPSNLMIVRR